MKIKWIVTYNNGATTFHPGYVSEVGPGDGQKAIAAGLAIPVPDTTPCKKGNTELYATCTQGIVNQPPPSVEVKNVQAPAIESDSPQQAYRPKQTVTQKLFKKN